jgi:hypothetical protein
MNKEFKVIAIEEGALGTIFLGSSKIPIKKMNQVLNEYGQQGWSVDFQLIEQKRMLLFWSRESVIITLSRQIQ